MPTKSKVFSVNGTVQSVAAFHDQNVAYWRKLVSDLRKMLSRLNQEREHASKIQGSSSAVQRLQATALKDAIESGDEGLSILIERVERVIAFIQSGGSIPESTTPAVTVVPVIEGLPEGLLSEIARLVGYDQKPPYDLADLLKMVAGRLDDHELHDKGTYAMNILRRFLGRYLGIEPKDLDGVNTAELQGRFKEWLDECLDLLDDISEALTDKRNASNGEIFEALKKLKASAEAPKANGTSGAKGDVVPTALVTFISSGRAKQLTVEGAIAMLQSRIETAEAMAEVSNIVDPGQKMDQAEILVEIRKLKEAVVSTTTPTAVPAEIAVALFGEADPGITTDDVVVAIRKMKEILPATNGGQKK